MSEFETDVLVVGAGPAGSATALLLARRGVRVLLTDRARFPREKPCGEYLTPGAVRLLSDEFDLLPHLLQHGAARLAEERVVNHRGRWFAGQTEALACPRLILDSALRHAAERAGATVREGVSARRVLWESGRIAGVQMTDADGEPITIRARITVGADGTRSLIARALGVVRPIPRLQRIALVGHFAPAAQGPERVTMHLPADGSDACCGVGAPCGPDSAQNVNIVVPVTDAPRMAGRRDGYYRERLARSFPEVWDWVRDAAPVGELQSVGCFGHHTTRAATQGAFLVGDAATFIHPFTGEGVYFALRGAMLAAETITRALQTGDITDSSLRSYDAARRRELLPRYRLCDLVQRVVHSPAALAWATERLRRSRDLTEALLRTVGDLARPADLFTLPNLRLLAGGR